MSQNKLYAWNVVYCSLLMVKVLITSPCWNQKWLWLFVKLLLVWFRSYAQLHGLLCTWHNVPLPQSRFYVRILTLMLCLQKLKPMNTELIVTTHFGVLSNHETVVSVSWHYTVLQLCSSRTNPALFVYPLIILLIVIFSAGHLYLFSTFSVFLL